MGLDCLGSQLAAGRKFNRSGDSLRQLNCPSKGVLETLLNHFFGCAHRKTSFPLTSTGKSSLGVPRPRATYVTCLECGAELAYDWDKMRLGKPIRESRLRETQWTEWSVERDEIG